jgi:hypothetical protein
VLRESSGEDVWRMGSESYELKVTMLENLASERRSDFERDFKASNSCFSGCFLYNRFQKIFGFWSLYECPLLAIKRTFCQAVI